MRILYSCKKAQQIISEGLDRELSLAEKVHLKVHLSMCRSCTNFKGQMHTLRMAMRKMSK